MKKLLSVFLAVLLVLTLASCQRSQEASLLSGQTVTDEATQQTEPLEENVIKIGVLEPQSGADSDSGKQELLGVQYANKEAPTITLGEKEYEIKLIISDSGSTYNSEKEAAQTLVNEGVNAVIGTYGANGLSAACEVFEKSGIPVISPSSGSVNLQKNAADVFQMCASDYEQANTLASYAYNTLGLKNVYIITQLGSNYSASLSLLFKEAFEGMGGTVVSASFESETDDFTSYVKEAHEKDCKAIFAPISLSYAKTLIQSSVLQNSSLAILGSDTWDSNITASTAKGTTATIYCSSHCDFKTSSALYSNMSNWITLDEDLVYLNGGNKATPVSAMAYDAYFTLLEAVKSAQSVSPIDISASLKTVIYSFQNGEISFDESGNAKNAQIKIKKLATYYGVWNTVQ